MVQQLCRIWPLALTAVVPSGFYTDDGPHRRRDFSSLTVGCKLVKAVINAPMLSGHNFCAGIVLLHVNIALSILLICIYQQVQSGERLLTGTAL